MDGSVVDFQDHAKYRLIRSVFELRGDSGGEKAFLSVIWRVGRYSTKKAVSCGGFRYVGRYVVDSRANPGEAWFGLASRMGRAHLAITRNVSVFPKNTQVGPPICEETAGTWTGTGGVLLGYKGTFIFNTDETLVLR